MDKQSATSGEGGEEAHQCMNETDENYYYYYSQSFKSLRSDSAFQFPLVCDERQIVRG